MKQGDKMRSFGAMLGADSRRGDLYSVLRKWYNQHGGCLGDYLEALYHVFEGEGDLAEAAMKDIKKLLGDKNG
jgi:hypothetical protein